MRTLHDVHIVNIMCFEIGGIIYKNRANSANTQKNIDFF